MGRAHVLLLGLGLVAMACGGGGAPSVEIPGPIPIDASTLWSMPDALSLPVREITQANMETPLFAKGFLGESALAQALYPFDYVSTLLNQLLAAMTEVTVAVDSTVTEASGTFSNGSTWRWDFSAFDAIVFANNSIAGVDLTLPCSGHAGALPLCVRLYVDDSLVWLGQFQQATSTGAGSAGWFRAKVATADPAVTDLATLVTGTTQTVINGIFDFRETTAPQLELYWTATAYQDVTITDAHAVVLEADDVVVAALNAQYTEGSAKEALLAAVWQRESDRVRTSYQIGTSAVTDQCLTFAGVETTGCLGTDLPSFPTLSDGSQTELVALPAVASMTPTASSSGVTLDTTVAITFNTAIETAAVTPDMITVTPSGGSAISGTLTWNDAKTVATVTPASVLQGNTIYTVAVSAAIANSAGVVMLAPWSAQFSTGNVALLAITSSNTSYDYGLVMRGGNATVTFTLTHSGTFAATALAGSFGSSHYTFTGGSFPGTNGTCSTSVTGGASCTLDFTYTPLTAATHADTFTLTYANGGASAQTVTRAVTGQSVNAVTAISAGLGSTCVRLTNNSVKCWGNNASGQAGQNHISNLGDGAREMGVNLPAINLGTGRTATALAMRADHVCAVLDDGSVKCWGFNDYGQLGQGDTTDRGGFFSTMNLLTSIDLGTDRTATAVATGWSHSCALLDNATVKCWGGNANGQLGLGDTARRGDGANEMGDNLLAIDLGTGRTATAIAAGAPNDPEDRGSTCALLDNATVKCWGRNTDGQLGQGDTAARGDGANEMGDNLAAIDLGSGRTATAITAGYSHVCALLDNATVKCWGNNGSGQLGLGDSSNRGDAGSEMGDNLPAIDLGTGRTATAIAAGWWHTCALLDNATVKCWGGNGEGALGQGDTEVRGDWTGEMGDNLPAIDLGTGRTATAIASGEGHACAVLDNQTVKCWGANSDGTLGQGDTSDRGKNNNDMGDNLPLISL